MKMNGKKLNGPATEPVVIPRRDGDMVFLAKCVTSYDDFNKLCPKPEPPVVTKPGGAKAFDVEDKDYKKAVDNWATQCTDWMILQSLRDTPNLEWETVEYNNPSTWGNFRKELTDSGMSLPEINAIVQATINVNGLNGKLIEEATNRFLASQRAAAEQQ